MFMNPYICSRCQLRLFWQTVGLRSASIRPFGGTRQRHYEALKSKETLRFAGTRQDPVVPNLSRQSKAECNIPSGKPNGLRRHNLREERYGLDLEALGKESEILVLKESRINFTTPKIIEDSQAPEPVDILARVSNETGLPTLTEVGENIEELRPKESRYLNWEEFQSLQARLTDGFTVPQLERYIRSLEALHSGDRELEGQTSSIASSPILRISAWMPGISENVVLFDESPLRGYRSEAFTQKQRIVLDILRRHWQLEVLELNEDIGEIEIELRAIDLELLINGNSPPLEKISHMLIPSLNENIEVIRSRRIIRVTLLKDKCENVLQEILRALRAIHHLEVDIGVLNQGAIARTKRRGIIEDGAITELARVTETEVRRLSNQKLKVFCIDEELDTNLSTRADAARRLLLTSSRASDKSIKRLFYDEHPTPLIAVTFPPTDSMPWNYRQKEWVRWTSPTSKGLALSNQTDKPLQDLTSPWLLGTNNEEINAPESARRVVDFMRDFRTPPSLPPLRKEATKLYNEIGMWEEVYSYPTSIVVGYVLHEVLESHKASIMPVKNATIDDSIFLPAAPRLSNLLRSWNIMDGELQDSLVMRFIPSPWTSAGPKALQEFPPVEIDLSVNPDTGPELREVKAIVDSAALNIMLPDRTVDLQFRQRGISQLSPSLLPRYPQIIEFIRSSQLDPSKGRVKTPTGLILPAAHMYTDGRHNSLSPNHMEIEYLFAGLEFRSTLVFEFEGLVLSYASIECGKADGRRGEFSLHKDTFERGIGEGNGLQILNFIKSAYRLVETLSGGAEA